MVRILAVAMIALLNQSTVASRSETVVWAWERPEALQTLPPSYGVAVVSGFIRLRGGAMIVARGRRFPLVLGAEPRQTIGVVHIEIDQTEPLDWTPALQSQVVAAALAFARPFGSVQVDMEVRQSQHGALLDVLNALRSGLAKGTTLSMTALASWCDTEHWLAMAPVDEIVPMMFRMGRDSYRLRARLDAGGDFTEPRCRTAIGISTDAPVTTPPGRRVYIFNPHSWDPAALQAVENKDIR